MDQPHMDQPRAYGLFAVVDGEKKGDELVDGVEHDGEAGLGLLVFDSSVASSCFLIFLVS